METARRGEHVDTGKLTLAEYLKKWETGWATTQVGPKTAERYGELLRLHVSLVIFAPKYVGPFIGAWVVLKNCSKLAKREKHRGNKIRNIARTGGERLFIHGRYHRGAADQSFCA
jgi:hypothetical protein